MNKLKQTNLAKVPSPPARVCCIGLVLVLFLILFTTCKKYDEGGFVKLTDKHLFGGHKHHDKKTWKLKKYEVNGIDSTYLIQGANTISDFYDKFVTFEFIKANPSTEFVAKTYTQKYVGSIDNDDKNILFGFDWETKEDSMQCKTINGQLYCERNILFPEYLSSNPEWKIIMLTKKEMIITVQLKNSYKIILTQ